MADPKSEDDTKSNKRTHDDFTGDDAAGKLLYPPPVSEDPPPDIANTRLPPS